MNSGTFHATSQEWRYFSREKALIHTLHLGQLVPSAGGEQVIIAAVPPTGTPGSNFSVPKLTIPTITPYLGVNITEVHNNYPPLWLNAINPADGNSPQSGSYGMWTGVFWSDSVAGHNSQDTGAWWRNFSTGGTFLMMAYNDSSRFIDTYPDAANTFESTLSRANPLDATNQGVGIPPASNYADAFYQFKGYWTTPGDGYFNTFKGNKAIDQFGNADGQEFGTIVAGVPFSTWLGQHLTRVGSVNYIFGFLRDIQFRLGP